MEHDAERVDVGARGHRVAAHLLRARALERHRAHDGHGPLFWRAGIRIDQLRDSEVEELGHTAGADEDVAGLQVTMDDEMLMGVLHRRAHLEKEREAGVDRQAVDVAVSIDGQAIDVLHHEIRCAVVRGPAIDQSRDVGVIEVREDLPLVTESLLD